MPTPTRTSGSASRGSPRGLQRRPIAEYLGELTGSHPRVSPWTVRGEEPKVHRWRDAADEREKAGALIAQLLLKGGLALERVAIVGMRRLANSCLAGAAELAGFPVVPIGDQAPGFGIPRSLQILAAR